MMRYLGRSSGSGRLQKLNGEEIARAAYDFDSFSNSPAGVVSSGEIRLSAPALEDAFQCGGVQLLTDDGRLLGLKFSEKKLALASDVAHVDVIGEIAVGHDKQPAAG